MMGAPEGVVVRRARQPGAAIERALELADANRAALGLFPAGAFRQEALLGRLLVAEDASGSVLGYLLFRLAFGRLVVAHLCVDRAHRNSGVAKRLITELRKLHPEVPRIQAHCRRDLEAHAVWPRLNFHAEGERAGRARDGSVLTIYVMRILPGDLFTSAANSSDRVRVAIDACLAIALQDTQPGSNPEIDALRADWIGSVVELGVTDEIFNDLNQAPDEDLRKRRRAFASSFSQFSASGDAVDAAHAKLKGILPQGPDLNHLARCVASGGISAFLTTDQQMLARSAEVEERGDGLRVLRPSDLLVELDSLARAEEYAPDRLAGTLLQCRRVDGGFDELAQRFRSVTANESASALAGQLRACASRIHTSQVMCVETAGVPAALLVLDQQRPDWFRVPLMRVFEPASRTTSAVRSLARFLATHVRQSGESVRAAATLVTDDALPDSIRLGLLREGFRRLGRAHVRLHGYGVRTHEALSNMWRANWERLNAELRTSGLLDVTAPEQVVSELPDRLALEDALHPAKLDDAPYPTLVVPIQPRWAQHLFDDGIADQGLFGADAALRLSSEHVYYRSRRGPSIVAPSRILWYVSGGGSYERTSSVRACSCVREVHVGPPSLLYARFKRLGVYQLADVRSAVGRDLSGEVMALLFDRTELFRRPIPLAEVRDVLGSRAGRAGPMIIARHEFLNIYRRGMRCEA